MNPELKTNEHSVGQNCFHMTWTPKYRYPVAKSDGMKKVIAQAITHAAERHEIDIVELRVLEDHVHIFVHIPPRMSVSECVRLLKGHSSHMIRKLQKWRRKYRGFWSRGYFYRSVGNVTGKVVENYIKNSQGKHAYWKQKSLGDAMGLNESPRGLS